MYSVSLLMIKDLRIKFDSDRAKTVARIVSTRFHSQGSKSDPNRWPRDSKSIPLQIISNLQVKLESDPAE